MITISKKNMANRVIAVILTLLTVIASIPSSIIIVSAQTNEHENCVIITVTDDDANPISGATVKYTIKENEAGTNNFETIDKEEKTGDDGIVEVLSSDSYFDDLIITATVSMEGYKTNSETIKESAIELKNQNFTVKLEKSELPDIEGVMVTPLDSTYSKNNEQELVYASAKTEGVTIEYSTDGEKWSTEVPTEENAGSYGVYVRMTKDGYKTYLSGKLTAKINKADITGIDITRRILKYKEELSRELVVCSGAFEPEDTVTWYVNGEKTENSDIPNGYAIGNYSVTLVVNRGDNYNEFSKTVDTKILDSQLELEGLSITGYKGEYDDSNHDAITIKEQGEYILEYQLDNGDDEVNENAWSETVPSVKDAGTYVVWVKASLKKSEDSEPEEIAVAPYNVYVEKATQTLSFKNYKGTDTKVKLTQAELQEGKEYDFSAVDGDGKANSSISYKVDTSVENAATIDENGKLIVNGAGRITITATLAEDQNHKECSIEHMLCVDGKEEAGKWISIPKDEVSYTLGNKNGIPSNIAKNTAILDKGELTYSVEDGVSVGLEADSTGKIYVSDYEKVVEAIEKNGGTLEAKIVIKKAKCAWEIGALECGYPADSSSYTLKITMANAPTESCKIYSVDAPDEELTKENGDNGWYNTELLVKPDSEYSIIRADELSGDNPKFGDYVKIGDKETDQGEKNDRCVYLRNKDNGEITQKVVLNISKVDTIAPQNLGIIYPTANEKDSVKYYGDKVTIMFVAYDAASGVDHFEWKYTKENGTSESILDTDSGIVAAQKDTTDSSKYIGMLTLPENQVEQLRGNLQIKAVDKAGKMSDGYTDTGVFVIDTIAPNQKVEYRLKEGIGVSQMYGGKHYFSGAVEFTFKIEEANFYSEDVVIKVSKDGGEPVRQSISWSSTNAQDEYVATMTLADDAEYVVTMEYADRSGKTMTSYTSEKIVVDTIAPTMTTEYSLADNSFENKDYYNKDLTATFTVTERNFYKEDVIVKVKKNDGTAEIMTPTWSDDGADTHIGTLVIPAAADHSNDGDYIISVEYKDRSSNEMTAYTSNTKVIDTTKPVIDVQYANNSPINELTDVENHLRKYYATTQTATVTITEHNFNASDVQYSVVTKDVGGNVIDNSALYSVSSWIRDGDRSVFTITYPGDANYTFDIEYTDLAKVSADTYSTDYFTVDTTKPANLTVSYSNSVLDTILNTITFGFYNAKATVTVTATDNISGVNCIKYSYLKASDVSGVNAEMVDAVIDASGISVSNGGATGTASFEIPRSVLTAQSQFNGTVNFAATDRANNESDYLRDTKRIVVDNIAPTVDVQYNAPVQTVNGVAYYDGDINATITVNEANFYSEDVQISVTKDGASVPVNTNWTDSSTDVHVGTFTLSADGDYMVGIKYTDKSSNAMQEYSSDQMTIDTEITEATITVNGQDADGMAFKDEVVPAVNFDDTNFESCEVKMFRTSFADKNVDVTDKFIAGHISLNETGGNGEFDTFDKIAENDGIYTITTELKDKAGHTSEKSITFTVNRFGSVYEYSDFLISLISDGGAYVQSINDDLVITEYNADRLVSDSLDIEILRDGKPLDNVEYSVSPEINDTVETGASGWYQYTYTIPKDNFASDGVYKIAVSSEDATGNSPENDNYDDKNILFRVDSTVPEITSITGLENSVVNATEQTVKYTVYDTIGLASVLVYVDGKEVENISDFSSDANNYAGDFVLKESSSAQKVRFVVTDKAGNITDTADADFTSSYGFNDMVTVSTNMLVRWFANKTLFYGSIGGGAAVIGVGAGSVVFFRKRKVRAAQIKK